MRCTNCGSLAIDFADSQAVCSACGVVLEESQIVSDITFAENTAGGAVVQGSYLGADQVRARTSGPGFRGSSAGESRECTIANARWNINRMATARGVPAHVAERALRFFQLALDGGTTTASGSQPKNFVLGRKSDYTVASCLYVACRMAKTTHMLIDFADVIQVNVFVLGRSYLRLLRVLNLQMPLIDPSFYISRFAALLEFGDETQRVVTDATRLVTRFKTDWMVEGRRPAGICGACLLLAARMNHFRRSVTEIVQVVKIADVTLRKRLEEFKSTPSGQLTIEDFRSVWLEEENNPPAFSRARAPKKEKESASQLNDMEAPVPATTEPLRGDIDQLADQATEQEINSFLRQAEIQALDNDLAEEERQRVERAKAGHIPRPDEAAMPATESVEADRAQEASEEGEAAAAKETRTQDDLDDLDEDELDSFILSEEEVKIKERVWMEFNKDYLEAALARQLKLEADQKAGIAPAPRNRKRQKPRDGTTAPTQSAAESAKQMMQQKRWSRRINYDVLNSLFPGAHGTGKENLAPNTKVAASQATTTNPRDMEDDSEEEEDESQDEGDAGDGPLSKRSRTSSDWMALGGLTRPEEEDTYADDYDDAW
ncbi:transcription factor TFIIIB subunit BBrf1 [Malassezia pachydermatis]|uniref:B-related factor 1 n=1 Tax=Malassezia pachydermatis TaxID=77020 RepID=A0A0M9VQK6_9BASI|nr:transcription factor tfiiib complex subunit brf1 [Malassezia pachydermatis]KOS15642.1 transcription factor tfiiib complex subunit brf1 [Malassezia pachydermatis]